MAEDWTDLEVQLIVEDYFLMLTNELNTINYNKSQHRKQILPLLKSRSEGSIEFKHQNISAVLYELKQPFIRGYKPRFNYQKTLAMKVIEYLERNPLFEQNFQRFADVKVDQKILASFSSFLTEGPTNQPVVAEKEWTYNPIKINYLEREQNNRLLGELGEELVLKYEKWRLISLGKEVLADRIEWISKDKGDGAGFDILSKNENGSDRYIEVKTTKLSKEAPIFFSRTEYQFSKEKNSDFHLYRVYDYSEKPRMFMKNGAFDNFCTVQGLQFKGIF